MITITIEIQEDENGNVAIRKREPAVTCTTEELRAGNMLSEAFLGVMKALAAEHRGALRSKPKDEPPKN